MTDSECSIPRIQVSMTPKLNLAFYQNAVPVIQEIVITNEDEAPLQNLKLSIISEPAFFKSRTWSIDAIRNGQSYHLKELDVLLDGGLLARLTEAETAQVCFILRIGDEIITQLDTQIELLARNQWGGIGQMSEMIAAFVQPNEPAIEHLLKNAAEILRKHNKDSALNGYEGGPRRAWDLASAIWAAVGAWGLDYSLPPASFEQTGQKIRGPAQIADSGIATCMDITLLLCAALEQCGLNPLIIFTQGHAFCGLWLKAEEFTTVVVDDIAAIRKRLTLNELVLFETTLVTKRPCPGFKRAVEIGARHVTGEQDEQFELAVDISRARLQRIKPLASEEATTPSSERVELKEELESIFEEAPDLPDDVIIRKEKPELTQPQDRLERWQRKLLDLSLRNNLLNFRTTKRAIQFEAPDPGHLEDLLADGQTLKLRPRPDLMDGGDLRSQSIFEDRTSEDLRRNQAMDALKRKEVLVSLPNDELESRLVELYRHARANLQEGGANTLFLALGFLLWTRNEKENKRYQAPLILIPITLQRKSVRSGFNLKIHDDEPRFNPTLIEMLRQDFGLELPISQGELPKDAHGLDITGIWKTISHTIKDIKGWEVLEKVVLSTFSFAKYLMWKDLVDRTDQLKQSRVVKHLIDTPRESYPSDIAFPDPRILDQTHGPETVFCPLPADSSQLSAVIAAAEGKDYVLIGPPGTGKSQTIANLIAHCLAEQKTVLFVSEKIAALNVVYRRLCDIKLGDFCLQLHSNKARKLDVIQQLKNAWGAKGGIDSEDWKKKAKRLKILRDELNIFVRQLHEKRRNGLTAYEAIGQVVSGTDVPTLGISWPSWDVHSEDDLFALEELAEKLDIQAKEVGSISHSPLSFIQHSEWSPNWQQSIIDAAKNLISLAKNVEKTAAQFLSMTGLPNITLNVDGRNGLIILCQILPSASGQDYRFFLSPNARTICAELENGLSLLEQYRKTKRDLSEPWPAEIVHSMKYGIDLIKQYREKRHSLFVHYGNAVDDIDVVQLRENWEKADKSFWPLCWHRRRRVKKTLDCLAEGEQDIEVHIEIEKLSNLREIEYEINNIPNLSKETSNLWGGLETRLDDMVLAISFQEALSSEGIGKGWVDEDFEPIANGRCGVGMAADLDRLRLLRTLKEDVEKLNHLESKTNRLWSGIDTHIDEVEKALKFQEKLSFALGKIATSPGDLRNIKNPLEILLGDCNSMLESGGPIHGAGSQFHDAVNHLRVAYKNLAAIAGKSPSSPLFKSSDTPDAMAEACNGIIQFAPKLHAWCAWRKVRSHAMSRGLAPLVEAIHSGVVELGKVRDYFKIDYARWWLNATFDNDEVLRKFVSAEHERRIFEFKNLDDEFTKITRDYVRAGLCAELPDKSDSVKNSEWGILRHEMQKKRRHMPLRELLNNIPSTITKLAPCLLMSPLSIAQYLSADSAPFDIVVFDEASQIPVWDAIGAIARGKQVVLVGDPKQLPPTSFFDRAETDFDYEDVEGDLESILDESIGANLPTLNLSWHYRSRHESLIAFSNNRYYNGKLVTFPSPVTEDRAVSLQFVKNGLYEKGGARINKPEARSLVNHIVSRINSPSFQDLNLSIGIVTFNSEQQRLIEDLLDYERRKTPSIEAHFSEDINEPVFVKNLESVQGDERDIIYFSTTYGPDATGAISMNFGPMNKDGGERRLNVAITRARHELIVFSSLRPELIDLTRTQSTGVRDLKHFLEFAERGPRALAEAVYGNIGDYESPFEEAVAEALANKGWQVHPQIGVSSFRIDLGIVDPDAPGRYLAGIECDGATYHRSATARDRDKIREYILRGLGWEILRIWSTDWWIDSEGALEKVHHGLEKLLEELRDQRSEKDQRFEMDTNSISVIEKEEIDEEQQEDENGPPSEVPPIIPNDQKPLKPGLIFPYHVFKGPDFRDPREINSDEVSDGLCQIIEVEGPILAKRAYDLYLRGCGIKRMGKELKRLMNKSLQKAVSQRRVVVEDELDKKGYLQSIVRLVDTPPIVLRERGPRTLEEIPPSEVYVVSELVLRGSSFEKGSDEHLHAILEKLCLKRLTPTASDRLSEIICMDFQYARALLEKYDP